MEASDAGSWGSQESTGGVNDAFLGEILIVHFQAGNVLAHTQQMGDRGRGGDAACPRTLYTR